MLMTSLVRLTMNSTRKRRMRIVTSELDSEVRTGSLYNFGKHQMDSASVKWMLGNWSVSRTYRGWRLSETGNGSTLPNI